MTYDPETYWPDRFDRQGMFYVAKGGRKESYGGQATCFGYWLAEAMHERYTFHALDFGCGPGRFAAIIAKNAVGYTGFDLVEGAMALNPLRTSTVLPERFDALVAVTVFQHIPDDDIIRDLGRRLDDGGDAYIIDQIEEAAPGPHMHYRSPERVAELLGCQLLDEPAVNVLGHWARIMEK